MIANNERFDLPKPARPVPRLLYPSLIVAAISVTLFGALGIAGITGYLPESFARGATVVNGGPMPIADRHHTGSNPRSTDRSRPCASCGVVESIDTAETRGSGSGTGAVLGGVAGAVIGNAIGGGERAVMTLVGGGAGAYVGNEIEKNSKRSVVWRTAVRMADGRLLKFTAPARPDYAVGAAVRIVDGRVEHATASSIESSQRS